MGHYAQYIVPAYAISVLVIGAMTLDTVLRARRWKAEVARREQALDKAKEKSPI